MYNLELIATTTFGLEAVVKREVQNLGYKDVKVENGKVTFKGDESAIARANLWLRSADRVLLKLGEFKAFSFEELFEKTKALPWGEWITENGKFTVTGKSIKSKLYSVPDCQSIVKKAVVEKLKKKYNTEWFKEDGPEFTIQVALLKDKVTLTIDTSGVGLHKRGYRENAIKAPLKETLAAAMIQLSFFNKDRILLDPFCGSGTIPIEAAMIGKNIAPGLNRNFASENWPRIGKKVWKEERVNALKAIRQEEKLEIFATDINHKAIKVAKENAFNAGVDECIDFKVQDFKKLNLSDNYGILICNPPYGERLGGKKEVEDLYEIMGDKLKRLKTWSKYILTSNEDFEKIYGSKADKRRKLYNGRIKVDYYQYYGPRPPKK
ncbi:MAG: class I SAM-dependent RNA methyltransferase [Firmicutes bacterium]|nr:class I SAM-dependent RNA methyltransferase [Bacillota bacterium]